MSNDKITISKIGDKEFRTKDEFEAHLEKMKKAFFAKGGKIRKIGTLRTVSQAKKSIDENKKRRDPLKTSREYGYE